MADTPIDLSSADNPRIKAAVRLREHRERRKTGLFLAEGLRESTRALDAGLRPIEVFWSPKMIEPATLAAPLQLLRDRGGKAFTVTPTLAEKLAYCENPQGVVAVFEQRLWSLDGLPVGRDELWLVAMGTEKPGNLGAMARSAAAAGAAGLIAADGVVDAYNPNAIRASTGAVFTLPVVTADAATVIDWLRRRNVRIHPAMLGATLAHSDADLTGPAALVIGPEDAGLDERWRSAGTPIAIPMPGKAVDSLNASNAAAILLFEAVRQRRLRSPK